ncbi:hypothetical protein [Gorillibacterium timonense]|uniref:hypothetical protein n=1 Tax=Gorillibacterium timonense TaxID=1689269 RepID=UPI00071C8756|nr:hypothetical protein [Gorillibacterium timonense]
MSEKSNETVKLSQWDALLVESLRGKGLSDDELLDRVKTGALPKDESRFEFDYHRLTELQAENPDVFEQAVKKGYQIKFNTIGGIRSWIEVALDKEALLELGKGKEAVEVRLTAGERALLESVLSYGWQIAEATPEENGEEWYVKVKPIQHS